MGLCRGSRFSDPNKKIVIVKSLSIYSFSSCGRGRSSRTSRSARIATGAPRQSPPLCDFSPPPPSGSFWEISKERARPVSFFLALRRLTKNENIVSGGEKSAVITTTIALRTFTRSFCISLSEKMGTHLADLLESFRSCEEWRRLF
jgi:hypothetical protein